jgi:hypothetical protein
MTSAPPRIGILLLLSTFSRTSTYNLRLKAVDGAQATSDFVTIRVIP